MSRPSPTADDVWKAIDDPTRQIMTLPAYTIAGLVVKARAARLAFSWMLSRRTIETIRMETMRSRANLIESFLANAQVQS